MTVTQVMEKMIREANGNRHDIAHFLKVYAYAKTIGEAELLDAHTQQILEMTAIVHDIACPVCREKYGNTDGRNQELESPALVEAFFSNQPIPQADVERISWLVAHHHTYSHVGGPDHQILLEADYLVNADEQQHSREAIEKARSNFFRTAAGIRILEDIFLR